MRGRSSVLERGGRGGQMAGCARALRLCGALAAALLLSTSACGVFYPGRVPLKGFEGQMLSARDASGIEGLKALEADMEVVRLQIVREGAPDYLLIESPRSVMLFYVDRDEVVRYERTPIGSQFRSRSSRPIHSEHYMQFANSDRERLARARIGQVAKPEPERSGVVRGRVGGPDDEGASAIPDRPR